MNLPQSPLTRDNYFDYKEHEGLPVIHSSCLEHIYPGQGGSLARLKLYFEGEKAADKPHQSLGKLFHKYLENKNDFIVETEDRPDPGICLIISELQREAGTILERAALDSKDAWAAITLMRASIIEIARKQGYQKNWKDDTIADKVIKEGEAYYKFLFRAEGHHMLTSKQKEQFEGMSTSVLNSHHAETIFSKDAMHEVPILFNMVVDGITIWCKALIDWLIIPTEAQLPGTISFIDFKTTSKPIGSFFTHEVIEMEADQQGVWVPEAKMHAGSYYNYRYYRQLYFYRNAVASLFLQMYPTWQKRVPAIISCVLPVESIKPYEHDLVQEPGEVHLQAAYELQTCLTAIAGYYKTLKRF